MGFLPACCNQEQRKKKKSGKDENVGLQNYNIYQCAIGEQRTGYFIFSGKRTEDESTSRGHERNGRTSAKSKAKSFVVKTMTLVVRKSVSLLVLYRLVNSDGNQISALRHGTALKRPMLIIQGLKETISAMQKPVRGQQAIPRWLQAVFEKIQRNNTRSFRDRIGVAQQVQGECCQNVLRKNWLSTRPAFLETYMKSSRKKD